VTEFVHIEPGQWVLAFFQPYGPYAREMPEHLELFAQRGGGWDSHRATEIFHVHQVQRVAPKTYWTVSGERLERSHVIAAGQSEPTMIALRDKLFAIGSDADDKIEAEMHRRIERFEAKVRATALKKVHAALPHIFGRDA
jgi:hypothetical protein